MFNRQLVFLYNAVAGFNVIYSIVFFKDTLFLN